MTQSDDDAESLLSAHNPEEICRAALRTKGVPADIIDGLKPGRAMDVWVHLVVMKDIPWQKVKAQMERSEREIRDAH